MISELADIGQLKLVDIWPVVVGSGNSLTENDGICMIPCSSETASYGELRTKAYTSLTCSSERDQSCDHCLLTMMMLMMIRPASS